MLRNDPVGLRQLSIDGRTTFACAYVPTEPVSGGRADALALCCSPKRFGEATCAH